MTFLGKARIAVKSGYAVFARRKSERVSLPPEHQGYKLFGGGTAIRLYCRKCKEAFLALPRGHQSFYIRSRCNELFPACQVIYSLIDPEGGNRRYIGRTHTSSKRLKLNELGEINRLRVRTERIEQPQEAVSDFKRLIVARQTPES